MIDTPQIDDFLLWAAGVATAIIVISASLVALRRLLTGALSKRLDGIDSQLHRNGGTSLRDAIDRIEEKQSDIQDYVLKTTERLEQHIDYHLDKEL